MTRTVRDIMVDIVATLGRNDSLQLASDIINLGRIRHFPVLDEGEIVGVVSQRDLYRASLGSVMKYGERAERAFRESIPVKEVMSKPPVVVTPETDVSEAARLMLSKKIGCLPVIDNGQLVGLVTETDMLNLVVELTRDPDGSEG